MSCGSRCTTPNDCIWAGDCTNCVGNKCVECSNDGDCAHKSGTCCINGVCRSCPPPPPPASPPPPGCSTNDDCSPPTGICSNGTCVTCAASTDCTDTDLPFCVSGSCVQCQVDSDCGSGYECAQGTCVSVDGGQPPPPNGSPPGPILSNWEWLVSKVGEGGAFAIVIIGSIVVIVILFLLLRWIISLFRKKPTPTAPVVYAVPESSAK